MNIKKLLTLLFLGAVCILPMSPVEANTGSFTKATIKKSEELSIGSPVRKSGGDAHEDCFYVTITSMRTTTTAKFRSKGVSTTASSERATVNGGGVGKAYYAYYTSTAAGGKTYQLYGQMTSGTGTSDSVSGRFTP